MSKKRYTKAQREQAAIICAIAASNPRLSQAYRAVCIALDLPWCDDRGSDTPAYYLALVSWDKCHLTWNCGHNVDAEAEALIRTGWSP